MTPEQDAAITKLIELRRGINDALNRWGRTKLGNREPLTSIKAEFEGLVHSYDVTLRDPLTQSALRGMVSRLRDADYRAGVHGEIDSTNGDAIRARLLAAMGVCE